MKAGQRATVRLAAGCAACCILLLVPVAVLGQIPNAPQPAASPAASLKDARKAIDEHRFGDAEAALHVYLAADGGSSEARYMLAYALLREGKATESLGEYTRAAALRKPSANDLRHVGEAYVLL